MVTITYYRKTIIEDLQGLIGGRPGQHAQGS